MIYPMYQLAKFMLVSNFIKIYHLHYLTVTMLNNTVELSSNLDPEPLMSRIGTPLLTQSN